MNKELLAYLKENKKDMENIIEQVIMSSLMPGFYGSYDIYLCEDKEFYVFEFDSQEERPVSESYHFLCSIKSHATDEKAFRTYLLSNGYHITELEEKITRKYASEYKRFKEDVVEEVKEWVQNTDMIVENIISVHELLAM